MYGEKDVKVITEISGVQGGGGGRFQKFTGAQDICLTSRWKWASNQKLVLRSKYEVGLGARESN